MLTDAFPRGHAKAPANPPLATARWSESADAYRPGTLWLGRDGAGNPIGHGDDRHVVTVAGSRSGKGASAIIPNLLLWPGSAVVLDPKGENARLTARTRAAKAGHQVVVLDPYGQSRVAPELRGTFNPLDLIDAEADEAIDLVASVADALAVIGSDKDVHWDESGRQLIEGMILHVLTTEPRERATLGRVRELLTCGDREFADLLNGMTDSEGAERPSVGPFTALWSRMASSRAANPFVRNVIVGAAATIQEMGDNERGSVLSTARRNTKFLDSPAMARALSSSTVRLDDLKAAKGGLTIYVCLPARLLPSHARFMRLVLNLVLYRMEAQGLGLAACGHPVLFVLDEFAALDRMVSIEKAAGLMAGYGVKLWTVLQDIPQLKRYYGESWETFLGNAGVLQFFANTDVTTLEWLSKRIGQTEVIRETTTRSTSEQAGLSGSHAVSSTSGWSEQEGDALSKAIMAPLQEQATREGPDLLSRLGRAWRSPEGMSQAINSARGRTGGTSDQYSRGTTSSAGQSTGTNQSIHTVPLMTLDELARFFDREPGLQLVLIGGAGPLALARTPWFDDPQLKGLVVS